MNTKSLLLFLGIFLMSLGHLPIAHADGAFSALNGGNRGLRLFDATNVLAGGNRLFKPGSAGEEIGTGTLKTIGGIGGAGLCGTGTVLSARPSARIHPAVPLALLACTLGAGYVGMDGYSEISQGIVRPLSQIGRQHDEMLAIYLRDSGIGKRDANLIAEMVIKDQYGLTEAMKAHGYGNKKLGNAFAGIDFNIMPNYLQEEIRQHNAQAN